MARNAPDPKWLAPLVAHAAFDLITKATCPNCGSQVVLYVCTGCHQPTWPRRRHPFAG